MNESELHRLTGLIHARLDQIAAESELGRDSQSVVELDQQSVGRLSRMDALQMQAMAKAQQQRRDSEALRLRHALSRMAEGEYGYCDDCGDQIPLKRLELDLAATRCVGCASG